MANPIVIDTANSASQFFHSLQTQQKQLFGENQAALSALTKAWGPVLSTGVVPYGYSPGLDSLLQANAIQTGTQAETNAMNAEALRQKQESGGANVAPTGANEALNAQITATGQQNIASGLQKEKIAGYQQGLANLEGGTKAELGIASATDPGRAAEAATGAGSLAEQSGAEMFKENLATGPMATFKGIAGGLADLGKAASGFAGAFHKGGKITGKSDREVLILAKEGEIVIPKRGDVSAKRRKSLIHQALAKD